MKSLLYLLLSFVSIGFLISCGSTKPYYKNEQDGKPTDGASRADDPSSYSLFLGGGIALDGSSDVLKAIQSDSKQGDGLVLLGDNVGLDQFPSSSADEIAADHPVYAQLKSLSAWFTDFYLLPGEKEWSEGKKSSVAALSALDKLLKDVKAKGRLLVPAKDCGMPEVVRLSDHLVLVLMDSQWAIESESRPGVNIPGCELNNVLELTNTIKDVIESHPIDFIVFASHHPLYANGPTAGNYSFGSNFIPLPVVGTLINGVKNLVGSNQHFGHPP